MFEFYELNIIPHILNNFKVNNIIIIGLTDDNLIEEILSYDASVTGITVNDDSNWNDKIEIINDSSLNILPNLKKYDAIFINDDPNWYTVFNQLNIIKNNNDSLPLIFICNNRFPNKRRDTYYHPDTIPDKFKHDYSNELPICYNNQRIIITDEYYHATVENTPKNGVLTAIEDFLYENPSIGIMDINIVEEITILYPKSTISKIRIDKINSAIEGMAINNITLSDNSIENKLLFSFISKNMDLKELGDISTLKDKISEKNEIIEDYESKMNIYDNEIEYKNTKIGGVQSQLDLKNSQIENYESILNNKNYEIDNLNNQIDSLENNLNDIKTKNNNMNNSLQTQFSDRLNVLAKVLNNFETEIENLVDSNSSTRKKLRTTKIELEDERKLSDSLKRKSTYQSNKLTSQEYCISCLKEEISNNNIEIEYIKNNSLIKKIFSPISYILIFKISPHDFMLNVKLYKALKNSDCFDIGFYLKNNKDIIKSKWCKYFSPELHYVCNGFNERRKFNKKYFNRNSRQELFDYLLNCEEINNK